MSALCKCLNVSGSPVNSACSITTFGRAYGVDSCTLLPMPELMSSTEDSGFHLIRYANIWLPCKWTGKRLLLWIGTKRPVATMHIFQRQTSDSLIQIDSMARGPESIVRKLKRNGSLGTQTFWAGITHCSPPNTRSDIGCGVPMTEHPKTRLCRPKGM